MFEIRVTSQDPNCTVLLKKNALLQTHDTSVEMSEMCSALDLLT